MTDNRLNDALYKSLETQIAEGVDLKQEFGCYWLEKEYRGGKRTEIVIPENLSDNPDLFVKLEVATDLGDLEAVMDGVNKLDRWQKRLNLPNTAECTGLYEAFSGGVRLFYQIGVPLDDVDSMLKIVDNFGLKKKTVPWREGDN